MSESENFYQKKQEPFRYLRFKGLFTKLKNIGALVIRWYIFPPWSLFYVRRKLQWSKRNKQIFTNIFLLLYLIPLILVILGLVYFLAIF